MAITFPPPPKSSRNSLRQAIRYNRQNPNVHQQSSPKISARSTVLLPHIVYFARLNHVRNGVGLRYAKAVAWRYFLPSTGNEDLTLAEVNIDGIRRHTFASLHLIPQHRAHYDLLVSISDEAQSRGSFTFRLLRIPCIHVFAVWLRSRHRGKDLLVPLAPKPHFLVHQKFYERKKFEQATMTAARSRPEPTRKTN
jgi:hypothetical protein